MFEKEIKIFKETYKIYEQIGEEFKASAYRDIYVKLQILDNNKNFLKSCSGDLYCCFKNNFNKVEKLKFETENKKNICFRDLFTQKTIDKILEIKKTGKFPLLEELNSDEKVKKIRNLTKIFGVGPSTARELLKKNINNFNEYKLKYSKFTKIQEFGIKYNTKKTLHKNILIIENIVNLIISYLKKGESIHLAGSYRGKSENPSDIDLIICNKFGSIQKIIEILENNKLLKDYISSGPDSIMGIIEWKNNYYRIDIKCTTRKYLATYLLYFGSGKYFSKFIRKIAKDKGYKLNQYSIEDLKNNKKYFFKTEKEIFKFLDLPYIKPEDRFLYW